MKAAKRYPDLLEGRMVKIDWTCRRLFGDDAGHVLVKDWPPGLRACCSGAGREADRVG